MALKANALMSQPWTRWMGQQGSFAMVRILSSQQGRSGICYSDVQPMAFRGDGVWLEHGLPVIVEDTLLWPAEFADGRTDE